MGNITIPCIDLCQMLCRNPTLKECEDDTHTLEMGIWEFSGTPENSEFDYRVKHLALRCFLYRWKGLEAQMSKMASQEPFGHLQHKLCAKERPGVKVAI